MEYCPTGDLSKCFWQNRNNRYNERTIKIISTQLLQGLQGLHQNGIIHCNLKPSNILVDEYGAIRICDFKKSLKVSTMSKLDIIKNKTAMTPCYTAPELFQEDGLFSYKSDLYSFGCIMYELAVGRVPFFDENITKLIKKIIRDEVNYSIKELREFSDEFIYVIKRLLEKDPNKRASWGEIETFSFWDGFFENKDNCDDNLNSTLLNIENQNHVNNTFKEIDPLKMSQIALKNLAEKKEDYNNHSCYTHTIHNTQSVFPAHREFL